MDNEHRSQQLLKEAYEKLKTSDAHGACGLIEQALTFDYENEEIKHALKCVNWWLEHSRRIDDINNLFEKGTLLINMFRPYNVFLDQINMNLNEGYEQCQYAVRFFVYSKALFFFESLYNNPSNQNDPGLLLLMGRCHKGIGNYDEALEFLEKAVHLKKEDAEILAEVADINALLAHVKPAKALFREAFFIDPSKIDFQFMESALIKKLREKVIELGIKDDDISEWIPVYGNLWGVFSVKRELKLLEVGRLKQSIFSLEAEFDSNPARRDVIKPRLLNHYFWLIDHYENSREDSSFIDETLLKIQVKDRNIYNIYAG